MISAFIDEYPKYLRNRKMLLTAFVCFVEFLLGIPCIMEVGICRSIIFSKTKVGRSEYTLSWCKTTLLLYQRKSTLNDVL